MSVLFRRATLYDVPKIIDLCNECFDENTTYEYASKVFEETMHDKNQIYIIGEIDGNIIAHTKITIIPTMFDKMETYAILNHVCVKPELRRQNIGTKMLEECIKICKENNCNAMKLWSMNFRVAAHECYKKFGFDINDAKFFSKKID